MLMRFDPFRDLDRLTQQLWGGTSTMPIDAYRSGDEVVAKFDLPGVDPASIELTVDDNVLTVSAERRFEFGDDAEILISERPHGRTTRQLHLGNSLNVDRVEAHYDDGVLTVRVPVADHAKPRRVAVAAGNGHAAITAGAAA
jgi:HSP20 family protein